MRYIDYGKRENTKKRIEIITIRGFGHAATGFLQPLSRATVKRGSQASGSILMRNLKLRNSLMTLRALGCLWLRNELASVIHFTSESLECSVWELTKDTGATSLLDSRYSSLFNGNSLSRPQEEALNSCKTMIMMNATVGEHFCPINFSL